MCTFYVQEKAKLIQNSKYNNDKYSKPPTPSVQAPPFWQGLAKQSFISERHSIHFNESMFLILNKT